MRSILLATDFSERSDRALRRATLLADQFGASLSIVHVVDNDQPPRIVDREREIAESFLQELKSTVADVDGLTCTAEVVLAAPHSGIVQVVEKTRPDLLVIGPHRRQALRDVFVGTTAERTMRSVGCPVLMVNALPVGHYRRAIIATDFSQGARSAAQCFQSLGMSQRAEVTMLHVFDAPALHLVMSHTVGPDERKSYIADQCKIAEQEMSAFSACVEQLNFEPVLRHAERAPAQEILMVARSEGADLIVMGTGGNSGLLRFFLGSVVEKVLRAADCDVLAVPPDSPVDQARSDRSE